MHQIRFQTETPLREQLPRPRIQGVLLLKDGGEERKRGKRKEGKGERGREKGTGWRRRRSKRNIPLPPWLMVEA